MPRFPAGPVAKAVKKAAKNKRVQGGAAAGGAWLVGKLSDRGLDGGLASLTRRRQTRENRRLAEALAVQVDGEVSDDTVIAHQRRYVVWKDGKPLDAFPAVDGVSNADELAACAELQFPEAVPKRKPARKSPPA